MSILMALLRPVINVFFLVSQWVHAHTVGPLVDFLDDTFLCSAEESVKLFVREVFVTVTRFVNGACAWVLALGDSTYKQSLRRTWQQKEAWHSWWREDRQSTLNAVLAAQCPATTGKSFLRRSLEFNRPCRRQHPQLQKPAGRVSWQKLDGSSCHNSPASTWRHAATNTVISSAMVKLLRKWQVNLLGKMIARPPAALAVDTAGCSTNPLLQQPPPMVLSTSSELTRPLDKRYTHDTLLSRNYEQTMQQHTSSAMLPDDIACHARQACELQQQQQVHIVPGFSSPMLVLRTCYWLVAKSWHLFKTVVMLPLLPVQLAWWMLRYIARLAITHSPLSSSGPAAEHEGAHFTAAAAAAAAVSTATGRVATARFHRRSIVFELPSGSAITHERMRPRGLLEELCLCSELCVTAVFEAARWLVRLLTLTRPKVQQQRGMKAAIAAKLQEKCQSYSTKTPLDDETISCSQHTSKRVAWGFASFKRPSAAAGQQQQQQMQVHERASCSDSSSSSEDEGTKQERRANSTAAAFGAHSRRLHRSKSVGSDLADFQRGTARGASALPRLTLRRVRSVTRWDHTDYSSSSSAADNSSSSAHGSSSELLTEADDGELSPAAQQILKAGYPLELHCVTTADGYILQMERIPRPGCARVAWFQHGILDTSLTWVSSGVTGSQAFAAWDQGFDVWLGSSRSNPPRQARDPSKQGLGYFNFSINELGVYDMPAQLDHLHAVKMRELCGSGAVSAVMAHFQGQQQFDPLLAAGRQQQQQQSRMTSLIDGETVWAAGGAGAAATGAAVQSGQEPACLGVSRHGLRSSESVRRTLSDSTLDTLASLSMPSSTAVAAAADEEKGRADGDVNAGADTGSSRRRSVLQRLLRMGKKQRQRQQQVQDSTRKNLEATPAGDYTSGRSFGGVSSSDCSLTDHASRRVAQDHWQVQQQQHQSVSSRVCADVAASAAAASAAAVAGQLVGHSAQHAQAVASATQQAVHDLADSTTTESLVAADHGADGLLSHVKVQSAVVEGLAPLYVPEVREPSTPELAESPVRTEYPRSPGSCFAEATSEHETAAPTPTAMGSIGTNSSCDGTPFSRAYVQKAAAVAMMEQAATAAVGSRSLEQQEMFAGSSSKDLLLCSMGMSCGKSSSSSSLLGIRRSQSTQGLMCIENPGMDQSTPGANSTASGACAAIATASSASSSIDADAATPKDQYSHNSSSRRSAAPAIRSTREPYDLRVVAHSLGGMSMLIYCVMRCAAGRPHHIRRLILMSPAGYHNRVPSPWWPIIRVLPYWHKFLELCVGPERACHPAVIPTYIGRAFTFSYFLEIARLPALADLMRAMMKSFFGGDASEWERALLMPHYSATGMPACSLHQALHFIQIIYSGKFRLYDYGSAAKNVAHYGTPSPPDIGEQYWRLEGLPIDLMAGTNDGIIPPSNVRCHLDKMREQGLQVSYREFAYGHMDFTFSLKEELRYYVLKCLNRRR